MRRWRSKNDEDAVSFYMKVFNTVAWNIEFAFVLQASSKRKGVKRRNGDMIELRKQRVSLDMRGIVFAVV